MKSPISIWLDAARPKTLPLALSSIAVGSALAYSDGHFSFAITLLALLTATLLQILSNLANDYGDAIQGTDNDARIGPMRGIQSGNITRSAMKKAIAFTIMLIVISGLALIFYSLKSSSSIIAFIILGFLSIISAVAYTVGSKPYGYVGLGDISVFLFFGLLGVLGTYFLHTGHIHTHSLLPAIGCGFLAIAVLNVNNMRDIDNDTVSNKRTIVVRIGSQNAKYYHLILIGFGWVLLTTYLINNSTPIYASSLMLVSLLFIVKHGKIIWKAQQPSAFIPMLPDMVKCALISNMLFVIALIWGLPA